MWWWPACCCLLPAAGLKAIYLSGWQVAGDANTAAQTYPDQSLYPVDSVPKIVERINNAFIRADQIQHSQVSYFCLSVDAVNICCFASSSSCPHTSAAVKMKSCG